MRAYTHICTHVRKYTRIYAYMHANTHICTHIRIYATIYAYMHAYTHICTHISIYSRIYAYMHAYTHICEHLRIYARILSMYTPNGPHHICRPICVYMACKIGTYSLLRWCVEITLNVHSNCGRLYIRPDRDMGARKSNCVKEGTAGQ